MYNSRNRLSKGCYCMQETMPLGKTYMYNFGNRLSKGCCCMCDKMPLGRTYMYNFGYCLSKGCYMCDIGRTCITSYPDGFTDSILQ